MAAKRKGKRKKDRGPKGPPQSDSSPPSPPRDAAPPKISPLPVVGIGASAGGLDAFKAFLSHAPVDTGLAYVLVPHLDPTHESMMAELLAHQTQMPVSEAKDGESLEPNHVYVIPPSKYLAVSGGRVELVTPMERRGLQTAIDYFFTALAQDQGENAIAIVFSGTGKHGSAGLEDIKRAGGMVMVQDPATASHDQMPRNAIATGLVDFVLPPEKMPEALLEYLQRVSLDSTDSEGRKPQAEVLSQIIALLRVHTKYDFGCYRTKMVARRVRRRMSLRHLADPAEYLELLRGEPDEVSALYHDLLIGVTGFFREPEAFRVLEERVIPTLIERKRPDTPVRVWVPGCATGEEAYSLAMLLLEGFAAAKTVPDLQVFATDIDERSLETGRQGIYAESVVADISPQRRAQFFVKVNERDWQVSNQLRESVVFAPQNLISDAPFSKLDLVSCRNLLIYLQPVVQQKVVGLFHFALGQDGYLLLGPSESIGRQVDLFEPISKKWRVYRRVGPLRRDRVEIPIVAAEHPRFRAKSTDPSGDSRGRLAEAVQKALLQRFAPASVLISRRHEVLWFQGPTVDYIEFPSGEPTQDLLVMAREGLRTKIRAAVTQAVREGSIVKDQQARVKRGGRYVPCSITAIPMHEPKDVEGTCLVTFEDRPQDPDGDAEEQAVDSGGEARLVQELEYELKATRDDLQSTIEELESSNEELKASNEEVMSMNEELQSANEELETSKEELQSLNEELTTVNHQLEDKVEELDTTNSDLENLLTSTEIPTVILDNDMRIQRFTPVTRRLFNLIATDVGRPMSDFTTLHVNEELLSDAHRVLESLTLCEREVTTDDERCYLRRILPYRTSDNHIRGIVVTFIDITDRKQAEEESRRLAAVVRDSHDAITLQDLQGKILAWNHGAERMYGYTESKALRMNIRDIVPDTEQEQLRSFLQRASEGEPLLSLETQRQAKDGRLLDVLLTVTPLQDEIGKPFAFATTERDISDLKASQKLAERRLEEQLSAVIETALDAIITIDGGGVIESFNPAAETIFGYAHEEAIGQNVSLLMPSPHRELHGRYITRFLETGESKVIGTGRDVVACRKDGTTFPAHLTVSEIDHEARFSGFLRDTSEQKGIQARLLDVAEKERERIGRDLHDQVGQELTGLGFLAGDLRDSLEGKKEAQLAAKLAGQIGDTLKGVRILSRGLVPERLTAGGLPDALRELARKTEESAGVNCAFKCESGVQIDDAGVETHCYRIVQESIANALRHGQAKHILIELERSERGARLDIIDDGIGLRQSHRGRARGGKGLGVEIMQQRATLIGGTLAVSDAEGGGTQVTLRWEGAKDGA